MAAADGRALKNKIVASEQIFFRKSVRLLEVDQIFFT
jgi:hypothetical protein